MLGREGKSSGWPEEPVVWGGLRRGAGFWRSEERKELEEGTRSCLSWQDCWDFMLAPCSASPGVWKSLMLTEEAEGNFRLD